MRYTDLHLQRVAVAVGAERDHVHEALAAGRYEPEHAARTGQVSLAAAPGWTGPQLGATAGHRALEGLDPQRDMVLHLHATIHDPGADFWAPNAYVARELGLRRCMTFGVNAMSNSLVAGIELAASTISAWPGQPSALVTAGDTFELPRFDRWRADAGMCYGDAGAAVSLGPAPGVAQLLSTASAADPELEGLNRGDQPWHANEIARPPVQLRPRKRAWVRANGGPDEVTQRNAACVTSAVKTALYEADTDLNEIAAVLAPHYGRDLLQEHVLTPVGITTTRTAASYGSQVGHLGASDQLAALQYWCSQGRLQRGDRALLLGIGVGMTHTAAVVEIHDPAAVHPVAEAPRSPAVAKPSSAEQMGVSA